MSKNPIEPEKKLRIPGEHLKNRKEPVEHLKNRKESLEDRKEVLKGKKVIVTRKRAKDEEELIPKKYLILDDYLSLSLSVVEIAEKYQTQEKYIEALINQLWKRFHNTRETRYMIATTGRPDLFKAMKVKYLDSDRVNQDFLDLLSPEDSLILTDNEIIYCEVLVDTGDEVKAITESKLDVGLKKTVDASYHRALKLRSYYMKKKPNVAEYAKGIQKDHLELLTEGKQFIQEQLIGQIMQMKSRQDPKEANSILKALDSLGRTVGAFDDKLIIENASGDGGLDRILAKAQKAKEETEAEDLVN